jgi:hypothetical protein
MLRRLLYIIVALLLLSAHLSFASATASGGRMPVTDHDKHLYLPVVIVFVNDTNKVKHVPQNRMDVLDRGVIKEVPKTKRQPKPEKVVPPADTTSNNNKPRSKRRPEGMERPPDIIRRNNN